MDGTLALIFAIFGVGETLDSQCPRGCFALAPAPARVTASVARSQFNGDWLEGEAMLAYDLPRRYGILQPTVSASYSQMGEVWLGGGAKWRIQEGDSPFFLESAFQIGYHDSAGGPQIGGHFHFRSDVGIGYEFGNGSALIVTYDHRSNGGLTENNPGLETLMIEWSVPLE